MLTLFATTECWQSHCIFHHSKVVYKSFFLWSENIDSISYLGYNVYYSTDIIRSKDLKCFIIHFLHEENICSRCKVCVSVCAYRHVSIHTQESVTVRIRNLQTGKKRNGKCHNLNSLTRNFLFSVEHFPTKHSMVLLRPAAAPSGVQCYSYFPKVKVHVFSSISAYTGIFMTKGIYWFLK